MPLASFRVSGKRCIVFWLKAGEECEERSFGVPDQENSPYRTHCAALCSVLLMPQLQRFTHVVSSIPMALGSKSSSHCRGVRAEGNWTTHGRPGPGPSSLPRTLPGGREKVLTRYHYFSR